MKGMLGCLLILLFAGVFAAIGLLHALWGFFSPFLRGTRPDTPHAQQTRRRAGEEAWGTDSPHGRTKAGNARHEGEGEARHGGGKIFGKDEGRYVDFEEVD